MQRIVEINRTRLVNIYLADRESKTGAKMATAELPDGSITTVELSADILEKALKKLFEDEVFKLHGNDAGEREITVTYGECVKIESGKLSEFGAGFMAAMISNLIEQAFAARGEK